jgi:hypothetical protein
MKLIKLISPPSAELVFDSEKDFLEEKRVYEEEIRRQRYTERTLDQARTLIQYNCEIISVPPPGLEESFAVLNGTLREHRENRRKNFFQFYRKGAHKRSDGMAILGPQTWAQHKDSLDYWNEHYTRLVQKCYSFVLHSPEVVTYDDLVNDKGKRETFLPGRTARTLRKASLTYSSVHSKRRVEQIKYLILPRLVRVGNT